MLVYHGSDKRVMKPDLRNLGNEADFGFGFYVTPSRELAEQQSRRYLSSGQEGFVSAYSLDEQIFEKCKTLKFDTYSDEWLDFVTACRKGDGDSSYEIVVGPAVNDNVFDAIEFYYADLIWRSGALRRLKYKLPAFQICIRRQEVLDQYLTYETDEELEDFGASSDLLHMKYARVIICFAELSGLTVERAMDFFYHSRERNLINEGASDLHCMGDLYLARDLLREYESNKGNEVTI